jgi:carboxypeptidase C (cathepsin A)
MMHVMSLRRFILLLLFVTPSAWAAIPASLPSTQPSAAENVEGTVVTDHTMTVNGLTLHYRATAGTLTLRDEHHKPSASFFFVDYDRRTKTQEAADRPIVFLFNGGPGAASVWLHLGTVGPRRVKLGPIGQAPAPPYQLVDNAETWLDVADLVFIDPVGTGFSRAAAGKSPNDFYGVQQDVASVGDFIRLYTTQYQRWASPKFLAGESYGTTRAAALSNYLHDTYGLDLNGIVLVSSVLNFQTIQFGNGNDLPYALYLPTYATSAWYHHKLGEDLQKLPVADVAAQAKQWATEHYFQALAMGSALSDAQRKDVIDHLARYTGLGRDLIDEANLRIDPGLFRKRLLGDHQLIGRMDTRLGGYAPRPTMPWPEYDPGMDRYIGVYSATFNNYIREQLHYKSDLPYEVLSEQVHWKLEGKQPGYLDVSDDLQGAMLSTPHLKVLIANGYFDLATPFFATDYTVNHLNLGPDLRKNITEKYYPGGHMMYHDPQARKQLKADVAAFIQSAAPTTQSAGRDN